MDLRRRTLTVEDHFAKTGETRTVPLNSLLVQALSRLRTQGKHGHVFTTRNGRPFKLIRTAFDTACRHAKLTGVTPHVPRHTFASRLVMAGVGLRTVMELGGWKNLAMVQRYSHLSQKHKMEAVELLAKNSPSVFTTVALDAESDLASKRLQIK